MLWKLSELHQDGHRRIGLAVTAARDPFFFDAQRVWSSTSRCAHWDASVFLHHQSWHRHSNDPSRQSFPFVSSSFQHTMK
jgi:hypothetical protein